MHSRLVRITGVALAAAAAIAALLSPRSAHGEAGVTDVHEVPPFARSRTEMIRAAEAADASGVARRAETPAAARGAE